MLFASVEAAARIERSECRLIADGATAARARPGSDVMLMPLGSGIAVYAGDDSPLNKVVGLGFGPIVGEAQIVAVEAAYAKRQAPVRVELSALANPAVGTMLTRRGYVLEGFENVLGREPSARDVLAPPDIVVEPSTADQMAGWLDVVVTAFSMPADEPLPPNEEFPRDVLERGIADLAGAAGFSRYLARRQGQPVGGASLRIWEGVAHLCGAATLPAHRGRGVHTALLGARLGHAAREGCDIAVVVTQPGSRSQLNVQRRGFALLYTRAILVRH